MRPQYLDDLVKTATKKVREHDTYLRAVHDENRRRARRSSSTPILLTPSRPQLWDAGDGYDPYHVRSKAHSIAHSITRKLRSGTYEPFAPVGFKIPKPGGDERTVSAFQIADEVVSRRLLISLSEKNEARLSARAYGYRSRLSVHDAIAYVSSEFRRSHRLFVAEFDFSKFFDQVRHQYVQTSLDRLGIVRTQHEQALIDRFLSAPLPHLIGSNSATRARVVGLPQGTSISLFLANVVASELDRSLERIGVGFARYADDTLIWSDDYRRVTDAVSALYESAEQIGANINTTKSPGVRLLVPPGTEETEMRRTYSVDFLGHTMTLKTVKIKEAALRRIRRRIIDLLYNNLLREPLAKTQSRARLTNLDRDYATFIWQLRRYMYGSLSEADIRRYQTGKIPPMSFEGVMSFFPLVDDTATLRELDSWLSSQVWLAMRKRGNLLTAADLPAPTPHSLAREALMGWRTVSQTTGEAVDLRLPSFSRIAGLIRSAVATYGLSAVSGGTVSDYHYGEPSEL